MLRIKKFFLSALCICLAAVISGSAGAINAAAATDLPPGLLIGDDDGVYVGIDGMYFINAENLMPGDVIKKRLVIQNLDQPGSTPESVIPFKLTIRAEPMSATGPVNLLDCVQLELKLDGTAIFRGAVRGNECEINSENNMIERPLPLGEYKIGDRGVLDITLTVDPEMPLLYETSEAIFKWHFYAWREPEKEDPPPKTGLDDSFFTVLPVCVLLTLSVILVLNKKRRESYLQWEPVLPHESEIIRK